ncbi:MAG: class I SAM-dependent methyltransferase [Candidatus Berkelbacteria bacterium]|nr:class I SAM-dependent methyltransferase [Candidatus Berkelbacteria bacterium]
MAKTWVDELFVSGIYRRLWPTEADILIGSERSAREVTWALKLLGDPKPGSHILDWCGGYGRHALELARRGYEVTLLDYTASHLDEARQYAQEHDLSLRLVQADFRQTPAEIQADYAINLFSSGLGYLGTVEDHEALRSLHHALKDGADILIELMNWYRLIRRFAPKSWLRSEDGSLVLLEERELDFAHGEIKNHYLIIENGQSRRVKGRHVIYTPDRLADLLLSCGFEAVAFFGDLDGSPFDLDSPRLVVHAQRF